MTQETTPRTIDTIVALAQQVRETLAEIAQTAVDLDTFGDVQDNNVVSAGMLGHADNAMSGIVKRATRAIYGAPDRAPGAKKDWKENRFSNFKKTE